MTRFAIKYFIAFLLLVPAQAVVFNHLSIMGVAVPLVFLWLILALPVTVGTNLSTLLGFLTGLGVDVFCDTPGLNALCCTVLAFARKPIFHLYVSFDDDLAGRSPSSKTMGHAVYMKYMLTAVAAYCLMMYTIEAFQFFNIRMFLLRVAGTTVYTFAVLYGIDCFTPRRND